MAEVQLTEDAREDLHDLDGTARVIVLKGLKKLQTEPEKRGSPLGSKLSGNLTTFRKLVVGDRDYRIVYRVDVDGSVVVVWVIGRRSEDEVYQLAMSRLRLHPDEAAREFAVALDEIWHG
ncbi:MAG: type II toxin-antitoxin system mRNA interferase toxin, RelE/StbE family [Pseudonocardiales bacterium]|nr:type II toxin-antitoxin system mRNA interferase toxin, RelE/StbE family [Pseudonocardiales bacterium]